MRHRVKGYKLSRTASHRRATLRALATALIRHKRIKTTVTKAKATQMFVEPLITRAKNDTVHNRRIIASEIHDKEVVKELFGDVAEKVANRQGGYTRVVKLGQRPGDGAEMAILELVDYNLGEDVKPKPTKKEEPILKK
jgi:large subunit ribosomal protein L17